MFADVFTIVSSAYTLVCCMGGRVGTMTFLCARSLGLEPRGVSDFYFCSIGEERLLSLWRENIFGTLSRGSLGFSCGLRPL